jgi:hypothetical protein
MEVVQPSLPIFHSSGAYGQGKILYLEFVIFRFRILLNLYMKKLISIVVLIGLCLSSKAQSDNLQPEKGFFSESNLQFSYSLAVKKVLCDSLTAQTDLRIIVLPSFLPEYLISLDTKDGKTYLTYRIAKQQIWNISKPNDQIKSNNYKIEFDSSISKKIHELFVLAISQAKFDNPSDGLDGTKYFFLTFENGFGLIGGQTWSPKTEKLSGLVAIADWLTECAKAGSATNKDKMLQKINKLIAKFN